MKKLKDFKDSKRNNNSNSVKHDRSNWFLIIFGALFFALIANVISGTGRMNMPGSVNVNSAKPIELSFSDVLRRSGDIQTMTINGNDASGTLSDGTRYNATITYDPEMLEKFKGNIMFTSHDYELVNTVANRIIEINPDGSITDFSGTFEEFLTRKKELENKI